MENPILTRPGQQDHGHDLGAAGVDDGDDLARAALAGARIRYPRRGDREGRARTRRENLAGRRRNGARPAGPPQPGRDPQLGGYSAAGPDPDRDPQRLGPLVADCVEELGWERSLAEARVFADWAALVGADVAAHCAPTSLRDGELRVAAESTAWATQLRLLGGTLLARLVAELGPELITRVVVGGPVPPSWKHGPRSVRGGRGPRDTYG